MECIVLMVNGFCRIINSADSIIRTVQCGSQHCIGLVNGQTRLMGSRCWIFLINERDTCVNTVLSLLLLIVMMVDYGSHHRPDLAGMPPPPADSAIPQTPCIRLSPNRPDHPNPRKSGKKETPNGSSKGVGAYSVSREINSVNCAKCPDLQRIYKQSRFISYFLLSNDALGLLYHRCYPRCTLQAALQVQTRTAHTYAVNVWTNVTLSPEPVTVSTGGLVIPARPSLVCITANCIP